MKRGSFILIFIVYSLSALGIGIETFYCCGQLKAVSIRFGQLPSEDCEDSGGMKDCCLTDFIGMDVEDGFVASEVGLPLKQSNNIHFLLSSPVAFLPPAGWKVKTPGASQSPPLIPQSHLYLQHRILLI